MVKNRKFKLSIKYIIDFILAIVSLIISVIVRSMRWSLFFKDEEIKNIRVVDLFENQMIGYFGNNIFPLKLGDLLRASIMAKKINMSKSYLLGSIALERIIDIISLLFFSAIVLIFQINNL